MSGRYTPAYTDWYGCDHNGRVDSVWTKLEAAGSSLWDPGAGMWAHPSTPVDRDADAEISYAYTPTGQVDTMFYPRINTQTVYKYSPRKWLDTLVANKGFADIFKEYLTFDPTGQILQQRSQQGTGTVLVQDYSYDALGQLTNWTRNPGTGSQATEEYDYDSVGNRTLLTNRNNVGVVSSWRTYDIGRRANLSAGPNQLLKSLNRNALTVFNYTTSEYDPDGSMTERKLYTGGDALLQEERFEYSSWRGLNWKYHRSTPRPSGGPLELEWRYRYNAMGEREQKREVLTPNGDDVASQGYKWNYYLLGGSREQLNLWEGLQTSDATFCDLPSGGGSYVHLYPSEYLVYGVEYPGVREDVPRLRLFPDNTQEYRITDHLASVRATLDGTGAITHTYDYKPFGSMFQGGPEARQSFNSREKDQEAGLFNNGVRKLEDDDGRFTSIDPLWEKFPAWSPYQYGYNNPLAVTDPGGMQGQQLLPLVDGGGGGSPHVAGAPAPPRKDPTPSAFEDPTTVRNIFQMMSGIMGGVVAGAEFSSGYVIITGTGGAALPIGGSLITLSVPTAGLALAQFTDGFSNLFLKDEQEEPAPIPSGVGETGGIVVRKLTGWDGAPFTLGLIETIITTCLGGPPVNSITTAGYGALPLQYGASQLRSSQDQQEVKETED